MDLDFLTESVNQNLTMLFRDFGQWSALGENIPFQQPEDRAIVMKAVEFPLDGLNTFAVKVTASSDEETEQFEFERNMGLAKLQQEAFAMAANIMGPMFSSQAPPAVVEFQRRTLVSHQLLQARIFQLAKLDPKRYTMSEREIDALVEMQRQFIEAQKAAAQAAQGAQDGGGGNVVSGAFGGGAVPAGGAAPAGVV